MHVQRKVFIYLLFQITSFLNLTRKIHVLENKQTNNPNDVNLKLFDADLNWCIVWPIYDLFSNFFFKKLVWVYEEYNLPSMWQVSKIGEFLIHLHNSTPNCRAQPEEATFYSTLSSNKILDACVYMLKHTGKHVRKLL